MKGLFATVAMAAAMFYAGSAFATLRSFNAPAMTVAQVVPLPVQSGISVARGTCSATLNDQTGEVSFGGTFSGLNAPATAVLVHGPAGQGTGPAAVIAPALMFTAGVSGTFSGSATLPPDLVSAMINGLTYCDVSDSPNFPNGEIRGQLIGGQVVPAMPPSAIVLVGLFLAAAAIRRLRPRSSEIEA